VAKGLGVAPAEMVSLFRTPWRFSGAISVYARVLRFAGNGANPDTLVVTVWSSGSSHWSLRSTVGAAAKFTVEPNTLGRPMFRLYRDRRETGGAGPQSS